MKYVSSFLAGFKKVTHGVAVAGGLAVGYAVEHPEKVEAVVKAYPKAAFLSGLVTFLAVLYHIPTKNG